MENNDIEEIIEKYSDSVRAVCRKYYLIGGNEDDLFQEGMIGFLQALKDYDESRGGIDSESFKKFALMCARRQILDAIKHQNTKKNQPLNSSVSFDVEGRVDSTLQKMINPEDVYIAKEQSAEKLNQIVENLSDFELEVFKLYMDGKTQSKIAKILGKDVKSIDNTIQRIKNKALKEKK